MMTQGTEARRGETVGLDAKRDGPVGAADAPETTDNRENIVTTSEQQAVPVAQEDREAANKAFDLAFRGDTDGIDDAMARLFADHRVLIPCKSGEGAGESIYAECPKHGQFARCAPCCDAARSALTRDATQTREAELVAALRKIAAGNPTCDSPEAQCQWDAAIARAALNARGGA